MIRVHFMCAAIQRSVEKAIDDEDSYVACHVTLDRLSTLDCRNKGIFDLHDTPCFDNRVWTNETEGRQVSLE